MKEEVDHLGYPITYSRVIGRNGLGGDYSKHPVYGAISKPTWDPETTKEEAVAGYHALVAGDLRRLEKDQRDEAHLARYAKLAGVTPEQVKLILDAFFDEGVFYDDRENPVHLARPYLG
jgi:hypothetical protein